MDNRESQSNNDYANMDCSYRNVYLSGTRMLEDSGIENASFDAFELLSYVTGIDKTTYLIDGNKLMERDKVKCYKELIKKRASHVPLQHITGRAYFYGNEFVVNENVLVPRPDTEILVEEVLKRTDCNSRVLDMCTGSGCIILSVAANNHVDKSGRGAVGVDISSKALDVASLNRGRLGLDYVDLICSNLFEKIGSEFNDYFDVIVSNPPYIPTKDIEELSDEVKLHDPMIALDGSEDGLDFYRKITSEGKKFLKPGGYLCYEIGYNQALAVSKIMEDNNFKNIVVVKDLAGLDRVVIGKL